MPINMQSLSVSEQLVKQFNPHFTACMCVHVLCAPSERVVYISELGTEWTCVILDRRFQKYSSGLFWLVSP